MGSTTILIAGGISGSRRRTLPIGVKRRGDVKFIWHFSADNKNRSLGLADIVERNHGPIGNERGGFASNFHLPNSNQCRLSTQKLKLPTNPQTFPSGSGLVFLALTSDPNSDAVWLAPIRCFEGLR
jgi:hypothetical protein